VAVENARPISRRQTTKSIEDDGAALILNALAQPDCENFTGKPRTNVAAPAAVPNR
jgi:hypothetical protein